MRCVYRGWLVNGGDGEECDEHLQEIKEHAGAEARARHEETLPEGYTISWRSYGRGGRWRGVAPNSWVETKDRERVEFEMWWQVAADEKDAELRNG